VNGRFGRCLTAISLSLLMTVLTVVLMGLVEWRLSG
jgi:hypothetical protein